MKKLLAILLVMLLILMALAFTVPTQKDFENYITEKVKEEAHDDFLGINSLFILGLTQAVFKGAEYNNVKIGSTYSFSLQKGNNYKFVGFGTFIICVEGDLSIVNK